MNRRIARLPIVPLAAPVQLVLGLDGIGIREPGRKRRKARLVPMPPAKERAA